MDISKDIIEPICGLDCKEFMDSQHEYWQHEQVLKDKKYPFDLSVVTKIANAKKCDTWGFIWKRAEVPFTERDMVEVELCYSWICENTTPRKTINTKYGSYYLKHVVERHYDHYIPNGAFIMAALLAGYNSVIYNTMNGCFNMSFKKGCVR